VPLSMVMTYIQSDATDTRNKIIWFRGGDLNSFQDIWALPVSSGDRITLYGHDLHTIRCCFTQETRIYMVKGWGSQWFLAHLSWKLKWAILIAFCPSSVRPSVCLSVNFYIFDFFSRTTGPILTKLDTNNPWGEGIQVRSDEGNCPSPRRDNSKRVKIHWKFLKIFFSRSSRPNSIKLGIHYP
jgi:hypothetical protein